MDPIELRRILHDIKAALQAFNTPEGGKTLAQRLEGSKTDEYNILKTLLKKHLGFSYRYNPETQQYEYQCSLVASLEGLLHIVETSIPNEYPLGVLEIYDAAAKRAVDDYETYQNSNIQQIEVLKQDFDAIHAKMVDVGSKIAALSLRIVACTDQNEIQALLAETDELQNAVITLEIKFEQEKEKFDGILAKGESLDKIAKDEAELFFRHYINAELMSFRAQYVRLLEVHLSAIHRQKELYRSNDGNILHFSQEDEAKYGLSSNLELRNKKKIKPEIEVLRSQNMVTAVSAIDEAMHGNSQRSKVHRYEPTAKVFPLLAAVAPMLAPLVDSHTNMEAQDFLPPEAPRPGIDENLSAVHAAHAGITADLMRETEQKALQIGSVRRNIDRIHYLRGELNDIKQNNILDPGHKFFLLIDRIKIIEQLDNENRHMSYEPVAPIVDQDAESLTAFLNHNGRFIDASFEYEALQEALELILNGRYAEAERTLRAMCAAVPENEPRKIRINSQEHFFRYIRDRYGLPLPEHTSENDVTPKGFLQGMYYPLCVQMYAELLNNGQHQLVEVNALEMGLRELCGREDSLGERLSAHLKLDPEKWNALFPPVPANVAPVAEVSAPAPNLAPAHAEPVYTYGEPQYLLDRFRDNYTGGMFSSARQYPNMAAVMHQVLSNPKTGGTLFSDALTASAKALMTTLGCDENELLSLSQEYQLFKSPAQYRDVNGEEIFKQFIANLKRNEDTTYESITNHFMQIEEPAAVPRSAGPH